MRHTTAERRTAADELATGAVAPAQAEAARAAGWRLWCFWLAVVAVAAGTTASREAAMTVRTARAARGRRGCRPVGVECEPLRAIRIEGESAGKPDLTQLGLINGRFVE